MALKMEQRKMEFRKEVFEITFHYYLCPESGEQFTDIKLDALNMDQVLHQYRERFHIPFPEEIGAIRAQYGLPAARMSEVLGLGVNSYRQYEAGEMPSISNARLIRMAEDPEHFIDMVKLCPTIHEKYRIRYIQKAEALAEGRKRDKPMANLRAYLLGAQQADIFTGYRFPSLEKISEMVVFFSSQLSPYKTKLNKLLFYADFTMFRQRCQSISGLRYKAISMGPVPVNFQSLFEYLYNEGYIDVRITEFPQGYTGEQFLVRKGRPFNAGVFQPEELEVLHRIADYFAPSSTHDIIQLSHLEDAWLNNEAQKNLISYTYAFGLRGV
ncbi:MAG: DUF4065 domain-containing protein [Bacteroidetes bacterium]|nr:DUF4065 domain-containing protein [Bacteroidota bacterium]